MLPWLAGFFGPLLRSQIGLAFAAARQQRTRLLSLCWAGDQTLINLHLLTSIQILAIHSSHSVASRRRTWMLQQRQQRRGQPSRRRPQRRTSRWHQRVRQHRTHRRMRRGSGSANSNSSSSCSSHLYRSARRRATQVQQASPARTRRATTMLHHGLRARRTSYSIAASLSTLRRPPQRILLHPLPLPSATWS